MSRKKQKATGRKQITEISTLKRTARLLLLLAVAVTVISCGRGVRAPSSLAAETKDPNGGGKIPITTSSEEARKEFLQGRDLNEKLLAQDSIAHFDKAI